ncbi:NAD-binding protein [Methylobacter sp. Wu1]|uniref:potassium channel family protein n=1 Tax=Methylobacter sp. Wu1 TaxID=3119359 RepID=UPI002F93BA39
MKRVAVFGYSIMALETMRRLNQSLYRLIFIGNNDTEASLVSEQGFEVAVIDFRDDDALRAIGIGENIDVIFCFYPDDADNVFLTISARALAKNLTIIASVDAPESAEKLLSAGADKIIDPYEICGRKTHEMLTKPDITTLLDDTVFGRHDLNMAQIEIVKGSCLENTRLSDLKLHTKYNLLLIGVVDKAVDKELHFAIGEKEHNLDAGDVLVVMGPAREIRLFKEEVEACTNY